MRLRSGKEKVFWVDEMNGYDPMNGLKEDVNMGSGMFISGCDRTNELKENKGGGESSNGCDRIGEMKEDANSAGGGKLSYNGCDRTPEMKRNENNGGGKSISGCDPTGEVKADGGTSSGSVVASTAEDRFYEKLGKLNESSGLSLLFNFRQTSLDLYKFYDEVTLRGGYHQVTKDKKWDEVASRMNPKSNALLPYHLQKIYGNLLSPFEQIHHYRTSSKVPAKVDSSSGNIPSVGDCLSCLKRKQKRSDDSPPSNLSHGPQQRAKRKYNTNKSSPVEDEDTAIDLRAPVVKPRSAYQMFLVKECERLKHINGESSGGINTREIAIQAWRKLPQEKRKPYIEESKKDRERFNLEMKKFVEEKETPALKRRNRPSRKRAVSCTKMMWPISEDDYHVNVDPAPENIDVPNESDIELALQLMKNERVNNKVFQINSDEFWSLDLPAG